MSHKGKIQITIMFIAGPEQVAEGDRIFKSHAAWMARTHHREGPKAMLLYNLVKGPERENAMDPSSKPTGNTIFVLTEVYESQAGMDDHWKQASENWEDFPAVGPWTGKIKVKTLHGSPVIHSLW